MTKELTETVTRTLALAGEDFTYEGVRGTSQPASDVKLALKEYLFNAQGGVCFDCGDLMDRPGEFCHIVSRGPKRLGWTAGNIAIGHAVCNERQKAAGPVVWPADMARPDVVALEWPPFPVLRTRVREIRAGL